MKTNSSKLREIVRTCSKYFVRPMMKILGIKLIPYTKDCLLKIVKIDLLTTSATAPRYLGAKIAFHIQQQPLKWLIWVMPKKFRNWIKFSCHNSASVHLSNAESKGILSQYLHWPNCLVEMDEYVCSYDLCQRAGKSNDKKTVPLKLVVESFTRSKDIYGPLPFTEKIAIS